MQKNSKYKTRKKDGFNGQKAIVLPRPVMRLCEEHPLITKLHITDIGFYPKAMFHYREREKGSNQNILIYCVDGFGWADISGKQINIKQGEFIIIPRNQQHKYGADEFSPWSILWVHFKGDDASIIVDLLKNEERFKSSVSFAKRRMDTFDNIYETLANGYSTDNLVYTNMQFRSYLSSFCFPQLYNIQQKDEPGPIEITIEYMQKKIADQITLSELAQNIHVSTSHFSALFKKKTGYSPLEYFTHLKIQKACQYLEFTDMHVKELGYLLGFNDPFYFSRLFSKYMAMSPVEYRKVKKFK